MGDIPPGGANETLLSPLLYELLPWKPIVGYPLGGDPAVGEI